MPGLKGFKMSVTLMWSDVGSHLKREIDSYRWVDTLESYQRTTEFNCIHNKLQITSLLNYIKL